ncbi:MAG TPA: sugar transferase [Candidatus Xenobia bacterium]|jgi:lipopolysaccharide/colanic/teichoic acid biosynthesis glycosyltransferase
MGSTGYVLPVYKRIIDVVAAVLVTLFISPILLLIAAAIKWTDRGSILHWQTRVGLDGREFPFPKFRTMKADAEALRPLLDSHNHHRKGPTFKMREDPRVTTVGRLLRRASLDELPQLWCVMRGDMSLVGPRPPLPAEVVQYSLHDMRRLSVTPGLTCLWQVSGRADLPFTDQVRLDLEYIETQSLWTDVKILARTIPAVISGKGAY